MFNKQSVSALLALSFGLALTGCAGLPDGLGSLGSNLSASQATAANSMVANAVSAMQAGNDMDTAGAMAQDTTFAAQSFQTQSFETTGGASASASASASLRVDADRHLEERENRFRDHAKERIGDWKHQARNVVKTEKDNGDGTKTFTMTMTVEAKNRTMKNVVERTVKIADNTKLDAKFHLEGSSKNGISFVRDRERKLNDDGSWTVTYNATFTRKDGKTRTEAWTRTEQADGTSTGTGTITRFDGSVVTVTVTKDANGTTVCKTVDTKNQVDAAISQPEASTAASVTVTNETNGSTSQTSVSDTDSVDSSAQ